jgi:hypothetical protein
MPANPDVYAAMAFALPSAVMTSSSVINNGPTKWLPFHGTISLGKYEKYKGDEFEK